jgi:hypothetical protein
MLSAHLSFFRTATVAWLLLAAASPAFAQSEDDFDPFEDEEEEDDETDEGARPVDDEKPVEDFDPDDDDAWMDKKAEAGEEADELEFEDEFDADDEEVKSRGEGEDTASIYREYLEEVGRYGADEEALAWERYLKKYPNSLFGARVEKRLEELSEELYSGYFEDGAQRTVDGGQRELNFAIPMLMENIDPRSKLRAGFAWGIPNYLNLLVDMEWAIMRELSVHGGIKNQYTGFHFNGGAKYAIVKSARTNLLVTAITDIRLNFDPTYFAAVPRLGVGKRFRFSDTTSLDLQGQFGSDLAFIPSESEGETVFDPRLAWGLNATLTPSDAVLIFMEYSSYSKFSDEALEGNFHFDQLTFGLQFVQRRSKSKEKLRAGGGASVPTSTKYWSEHEGMITADVNYFLNK